MVKTVQTLILDVHSIILPTMYIRYGFCLYYALNTSSKSLLNKLALIIDTRTQCISKHAFKSMQRASDIETLFMHLIIRFALFISKI